jgi:hypothetical protein
MVRFHSTCLNTLSASPAGGPPVVAAGRAATIGIGSGRGCRLVLVKSTQYTGPTSVHKQIHSFQIL